MSVIDLIRNNVIATLVAGTLAGGTIIYVAAPGLVPPLGNRDVPDVFEVLRDGVSIGNCDLTVYAQQFCAFNGLKGVSIHRHAGDRSKVSIDTGIGGGRTTGITWPQLRDGVEVQNGWTGKMLKFTISAKPL